MARHLSRTKQHEIAGRLHDVLANDEHLVALIHATAIIESEEIDLSYAEVLHYDDRGLATKRQAFPSDIWAALRLVGDGTAAS